jgi:hypothetical protein
LRFGLTAKYDLVGSRRSGIAVDGCGSDDWNFPTTTFTVNVPAHNSSNKWGWGGGGGGAQAELLLSEYLKASHYSELEFDEQQASSYYDTVNVNCRKGLYLVWRRDPEHGGRVLG